MSSSRSKLRLSPSGEFIVGTANGDTLVWNAASNLWVSGPGVSGRLLRITRYTTATSGTHVFLDAANTALLRGGGGGGAGGGALANAGEGSVGSAASAAGVFEKFLPLVASRTLTFSIGAGGLGVQGAAGGNGVDTTATYNGVTFTGSKGLGGIKNASGTTVLAGGFQAGGTATNGDLNITGGGGSACIRQSGTGGIGGPGGDSAEAPGAVGASSPVGASASSNGLPGQFSSGGSGAVHFDANPVGGTKGGDGGTGFLFVWEFS